MKAEINGSRWDNDEFINSFSAPIEVKMLYPDGSERGEYPSTESIYTPVRGLNTRINLGANCICLCDREYLLALYNNIGRFLCQ